MHPITYSFILNVLALVAATFLGVVFDAPLLILVVILIQTHMPGYRGRGDDDDDDESGPPGASTGEGMGFLAKVS